MPAEGSKGGAAPAAREPMRPGSEPSTSGGRLIRPMSLTSKPVSRFELAAIAVLLIGLGALVFGSHVAHGGFWLDDWGRAATYEFAPHPRYPNAVHAAAAAQHGKRILLGVSLPLPFAVFGLHSTFHLALAVALGVLASWLFFLLLRMLGLPTLHAGMISALALVFPWSDSLRLWPTAGINYVAVVFYLLGVVIALRGLQLRGKRSILCHVGAVTLFLASVLTYEVALFPALLTGALYLTRTPARRAFARWAVDGIAVGTGAVISVVAIAHRQGSGGSLHDAASSVPRFVHESASLLGTALIPVGNSRDAKAVTLGLVAVAVLYLLFRRPVQARLWLVAAGAAVVAIAAAYMVFLAYGISPLSPGRDNRVNALAALPWAVLVYSVLMATASLLPSRLRPDAVVVVLALLIGVGYVGKTRHDAGEWERAADLQKPVLGALRALTHLPTGTTVYTFGYPGRVAPQIYIFAKVYDLNSAAGLVRDDPSLRGYPVTLPDRVLCGRDSVIPVGPSTHGTARSTYGKALFLDIPSKRLAWVRNRHSCREALKRFRPGPEYAQ
jgi:hypothetical protein